MILIGRAAFIKPKCLVLEIRVSDLSSTDRVSVGIGYYVFVAPLRKFLEVVAGAVFGMANETNFGFVAPAICLNGGSDQRLNFGFPGSLVVDMIVQGKDHQSFVFRKGGPATANVRVSLVPFHNHLLSLFEDEWIVPVSWPIG